VARSCWLTLVPGIIDAAATAPALEQSGGVVHTADGPAGATTAPLITGPSAPTG
jgi:hypothetical protein